MPLVPFDTLPDDARLWVFASDRPLRGSDADRLLAEADAFLSRWQAHGTPLTCGRDWRDDRFLAIAVDQSAAGASGCSIDGLYRSFSALERELGTRLLAGGRVFHRDPSGEVQVSDRAMFSTLGRHGEVDGATRVFDTSVTTAGDWRRRFERAAADSWHGALIAS